MQAQLSGTALITGASSGIGKQLARLFAADGWDLVLTARRESQLLLLAEQLSAQFKVECTVLPGDLADSTTPERLVRALAERQLRVTALVNNAGFGKLAAFVDTDPMLLLDMMTVNMRALVHLTRLLLPNMVAQGRGAVLNVGSLAGFLPGPHMAVYYASKAFVNSFSEGLSVELQGTGVTVTVSCPGPTATEFGEVAGSDTRRVTRSRSMPAEAVARNAYHAMKAGHVIAIPGRANHAVYHALRFIPRAILRRLTGLLNRATKRD